MLTVIRNGYVYSPFDVGVADVLIGGGKVLGIEKGMDLPEHLRVKVIDAAGYFLTPGLIDLHVHITGGGGEGGPDSRVPEIQLSQITTAGVTTLLGVLGTDDVTRGPEALLAKALGLEREGISAYILVGSYQFPMATITGSVRKDIALIPHVIGVGEIALSDHRSSHPSFEEFARIVSESRVGGLIGGKSGMVQVHMGSGRAGLDYLFRLLNETEIPISQVFPTHVTRSEEIFEQALQFARMGGEVDITAPEKESTGKITPLHALRRFKEEGVSMDAITFSSDSNGSLPVFDPSGKLVRMGIGRISALLHTFRSLVMNGEFSVTDILKSVTLNPSRRMGISHIKGALVEGKDADIVIFDADWKVHTVFAKGRVMVKEGIPAVKGTFEK